MIKHAHWVYTLNHKPTGVHYVTARCSKCGWEWFSADGVGNYSRVFSAFITNYDEFPETADAWLLETAKKAQKFKACPMCGCMMAEEEGE